MKNWFVPCSVFVVLAGCFFSSCGSKKDVVYFQGADKIPLELYERNNAQYELKIRSNDNLHITVSAINPEAAEIFNVNKMIQGGNNNYELQGYLVDEKGDINFPVIGSVHLEGLTKQEAIDRIKEKVSVYIDDPVINIRYLNYQIFILGEVSSPGQYTISDEKVSVPEAIAMAHDMTILADRHNVMIYRVENGEKKFFHLDMTSAELFFSENYYLQQNDILYVYPNGTKIRSSQTISPVISLFASVISLFFAVYAVIKLK
jgi:polysaccharide export outer membrane protein